MDRILPFGACWSEVRRRIRATRHESTDRTSEVCSENRWCGRLVPGSIRHRNFLPTWLGFRGVGRRIGHHARIRFFGTRARFGLNLKRRTPMKKKRSPGSRLISNSGPHNPVVNRHNVPAKDLFLYARSFHKAAKALAAFQLDASPLADFDISPVVFMYRHAVELHLKALVLGEGGNFLATKPDALSVHKTHSVSWLAQFVVQIITALKWEREFRCEGVENLADFKAIIEEIDSVDPGFAFRCPGKTEEPGSVPGQLAFSVREFARRMDAILELLDSTADALAATWDRQTGAAAPEAALQAGNDFEPTIH